MAASVVNTHYGQPMNRTLSSSGYSIKEKRCYEEQRYQGKRNSIISERVIEHEYKVPKRIVREEVIEKVIVVPERVMTEHMIEEVQKVREKIIEIAKPVIRERVVEVPDIVYMEKIIEVPETIYQEKVVEVPFTTYEERIVEVPKIVRQEKVVEIPDIQYREIPVERVIEVPEIREQTVIKEVPVPQYIDKIVPEYVTVEVPHDIVRHAPVPVEATTTFEYSLPQLKAKYNTVDLTLYVPRFIEVPVPAEFMDASSIAQSEQYMHQVSSLAAQTAPSLCEVENLVGSIKKSGIAQIMQNGNYQEALMDAWKKGQLNFERTSHKMTYTGVQYENRHRSNKHRLSHKH